MKLSIAAAVMVLWAFSAITTGARELNGQIFVVTAGAQAIKLPLVPVAAISKPAIEAHLRELNLKLGPERAKADAEVKHLTAELRSTEKAYRTAGHRADAYIERGLEEANSDGPQTTSVKEQREVFGRLSDLKGQSLAGQGRLRAALARQRALYSSAAYFVELPSAVTTAKSDADGHFTLSLPPQGEYVVVARAKRAVASRTENYYWMVAVDPQATSIMLSNDNLSESGSPDSMLAERSGD